MTTNSTSIGLFNDLSHKLNDPAALREAADRDGCLFFKGLLPRGTVMDMRRAFVQIVQSCGWLKNGTDPALLIAGCPAITENDDPFRPAFDAFQTMPQFHALAHDRRITGALDKVFGETAFTHPRHIGRIIFPDAHKTPPHQDFLHIRGTPNTWTVWIPMGDTPIELGGLSVWLGSHKRGMLPSTQMPGAGGSGIENDDLCGEMRTANYQAGDVVMLHSHTIHASQPNQTGDRMRLSLDYRYQPISEPIDITSLDPHMRRFDWEFVYRNWPSQYDHLKYYWKDLDLNIEDTRGLGGGY